MNYCLSVVGGFDLFLMSSLFLGISSSAVLFIAIPFKSLRITQNDYGTKGRWKCIVKTSMFAGLIIIRLKLLL